MPKTIAVIGAGGIVGQHMMVNQPHFIDAIYTRKNGPKPWTSLHVGNEDVHQWLNFIRPDVIVNLAGQNVVDLVEQDPEQHIHVNVELPVMLAKWCNENNKSLIQVSTQGIFSGENPEYTPASKPNPITFYGKQKALAERLVGLFDNTIIARLTFVIGIRPFQNVGRKNPLESMLEQNDQKQVYDRFFSPVFAEDAAKILWDLAINFNDTDQKIVHIGNPIKCSRYSIASDLLSISNGDLQISIDPVSYMYYSTDVARPRDTTWKNQTSLYLTEYFDGLKKCYLEWKNVNNENRGTGS